MEILMKIICLIGVLFIILYIREGLSKKETNKTFMFYSSSIMAIGTLILACDALYNNDLIWLVWLFNSIIWSFNAYSFNKQRKQNVRII